MTRKVIVLRSIRHTCAKAIQKDTPFENAAAIFEEFIAAGEME